MRTGVTLAELRKEVMIEAGLSTAGGHAIATKEKIDHLLNRTERVMAKRKGWPSIQTEEVVTAAADAQFVNLPTTIEFGQIGSAHVLFGSEWLPIMHGILPEHRSIYSTAQRGTPARRWEVVAPGTTQFEIWPISAIEQSLRFSGQKKIGAMVGDDDTCTLDGDVLVLRVSAELLGRDRKDDAQVKLQTAERLTEDILKLEGALKSESISLTGRRSSEPRPYIDFIPPGGT